MATVQISRRSFIAHTGTVLAGLHMSGAQAAGSGRRIIVAGAGMAGLNAALLLQQASHEVVVLEARERVGGGSGRWMKSRAGRRPEPT